MNEAVADTLKNCVLCRGMSDEEVRALCKSEMAAGTLRLRSINKGEYIFHEGASPRAMYILVSGRIGISRVTLSGRSILVEEITERGDIFGEVYLFLGMPYKICTEALEASEIIVMSGDMFSRSAGVCSISGSDDEAGGHDLQKVGSSAADYIMVRNMLSLLSQKAYMLSSRIQVLASPSIREKAARFILERELADGSVGTEMSREAMADYMGVTRPSLSRELGKMQTEGLIRLEGRRIVVTDQDGLEMYL